MSDTQLDELILAVADFIKQQALPELDSFKAYNALIAANSLKIAAREVQQKPALALIEAEMAKALSLPQDNLLPALAARLKADPESLTPATVELLKRHTMQRMAIDNPKYSAFQEATRRWPNEK